MSFTMLLITLSCMVYSAEKVNPSSKKEVLAFDAAVIEGERKNPTIFLDINVDKYSDIDSVLLIRKDFNDYHKVDKAMRTQHFEIK